MVILGIVLFIILVIIFPCVTMAIYNKEFGKRYEVREYAAYKIEDFPDLELHRCEVISNKGHKLAAYKYQKKGIARKAVLVMVHGLCGSHRNYLDLCYYFACQGFTIFTYDATGNGESEGEKVGGFAQGLADLDYVLTFVKKQIEYKDLPILLMGHSWGAYCVGSVLKFHPDVKAVVSISGFDTTAGLLKQYSEVHMGKAVALLMPYVLLYEKICWGKYSGISVCEGFENSNARVMVIHSLDDETIYTENGYGRYFDRFGKDNRFVFKMYSDRAHSYPVNSDKARMIRTEVKDVYLKRLEEQGEEAAKRYIDTEIDRRKWMELDEALMQEILVMFEEVI